MNSDYLVGKAEGYLHRLCRDNRRVGSTGNHDATTFFAQTVASFGFAPECPQFDCIDWTEDGAQLSADGQSFVVQPSPYSLGGQFFGPLVVVSSIEELEETSAITNKILLLRGEIAAEQLMPKNFPFYNPERHQQIINLLETNQPLAIVTATGRNPEIAGGIYPFPLIEDGDFDIASVFMTEDEGAWLAGFAGRPVSLIINAQRIPSTGYNVIARKGANPNRRAVVCAHIDAKIDTPGAIDNAAGVVVLLLLAELLADYSGQLGVEIVAINGEDYYAASGEIQYVARNAGKFDQIAVAINIDAAGYRQGHTAYSLYGCPEYIAQASQATFSSQPGMVEGEPWYQSDHSVFIQNGTPAIAITSERFMELSTYVTHTPKDSPEIVDCQKLAAVALTLRDLLVEIERQLA
jgi:aminopeptidase YwaD